MGEQSRVDGVPPGFRLEQTLRGHRDPILDLAWSPDGRTLASGSEDRTVRLWDPQDGQVRRTLDRHTDWVIRVAFSPDGELLASGSSDRTVRVWDVVTGKLLRALAGHDGWVTGLSWSPDGRSLASGSSDETIVIWDMRTWERRLTLTGHTGPVLSLSWSPDGRSLAAGSSSGDILLWDGQRREPSRMLEGHSQPVRCLSWSPDGRRLASGCERGEIRIWEHEPGHPASLLEGHIGQITGLAFSGDGRLLASKADRVRIWDCGAWETVATFPEPPASRWSNALAFGPSVEALATIGAGGRAIALWHLDPAVVMRLAPSTAAIHYACAKVVLVGADGVDKAGLAAALAGQPPPVPPSGRAGGRRTWIMERQEVAPSRGRVDIREVLLWDLPGRPDDRLVHHRHLGDVDVALLVFDPEDAADPFAGVRHWERALRQAQLSRDRAAPPPKKLLVAARDGGPGPGVGASEAQDEAAMLGCSGPFEALARDGTGIPALAEAIRRAIVWAHVPASTSTDLIRRIQEFLFAQKDSGRLMVTADDLFAAFPPPDSGQVQDPDGDDLAGHFEACTARFAERGLIRRLSVGHFILLQPERLDAYAATLLRAADDDPHGLGSLAEADVRAGKIPVSPEGQLAGQEHEELLRIATVEHLLRHELVLRDEVAGVSRLIFPSQVSCALPAPPPPEGRMITFLFEGPVLSVYATLVVRLGWTDAFRRASLGRDAATFTAQDGGTGTLHLREVEEALGELTLSFDAAAGPATRAVLEEFVHAHLQRRSLPERLRRLPTCPRCRTVLPGEPADERRRAVGETLQCPGCALDLPLPGPSETAAATAATRVSELERTAVSRREQELLVSVLQGRAVFGDYDVFLCYNHEDRVAVKVLGDRLKAAGLLPWFKEWGPTATHPHYEALEEGLVKSRSAVIVLGRNGFGRGQRIEVAALLSASMGRGTPLIPVFLADTPRAVCPPALLADREWVDFRWKTPDPFERLVARITARPEARPSEPGGPLGESG